MYLLRQCEACLQRFQCVTNDAWHEKCQCMCCIKNEECDKIVKNRRYKFCWR
jgi:hypothetical protein